MKAPDNDSTRVHIAVYKPRIEIIQRVVCEYFGIPVKLSQEHSRRGHSIRARQRIHYLCRELVPHCRTAVVGMITGNGKPYDHASVIHSYQTISKQMNFKNKAGELVYPDVYLEINKLRRLVLAEFEKSKVIETKRCDCCGQVIMEP